MDLKNIQLNEFKIKDILNLENGVCSSFEKIKSINGKVDCVGATSKNNGNVAFIDSKYDSLTVEGNCIVFIRTGEGSVGDAIYKKNRFIPSKNVSIGRNKNLNQYSANFIVTIINSQSNKYNYGYVRSDDRLKNEIVLLPSLSKEEPDYAFMEQYMRQKEQEKLEKFKNFISTRIEEVKDYKEVSQLNQKEWGEFEIGKLFKLYSGKSKGLNHLKKSKFGVNYLGATNSNNGVLSYVLQSEENRQMIQKGNCIAFIRNGEGSMGYSIYKAESFIATSDISVGYSENINRYIGLFITTIADTIRGKYNFGYKRSDTRLKKEKLQLPVDKQGNPDYQYMENYIKRLEYKKLSQYLDYLVKKH